MTQIQVDFGNEDIIALYQSTEEIRDEKSTCDSTLSSDSLLHVENGKFAEGWQVADRLVGFQQLGFELKPKEE